MDMGFLKHNLKLRPPQIEGDVQPILQQMCKHQTIPKYIVIYFQKELGF